MVYHSLLGYQSQLREVASQSEISSLIPTIQAVSRTGIQPVSPSAEGEL